MRLRVEARSSVGGVVVDLFSDLVLAMRFSHYLLASFVLLSSIAEANESFQVLFDGKSLAGWKGNEAFWSVQNGAIVGQTTAENPTNGNTFLIWDGGEIGDFEFRCKVRFEGNNSGVQYRSEVVDAEKHVLKGYQADLHPKADYFGMMYGEKTGRGIIATRGQQIEVDAEGKTRVVGEVGDGATLTNSEWNDLRIVAVNNVLVHQVNGVTTVQVTDDHPDAMRRGVLGLQLHAGPPMKVEFRNLLLRKLEGDDATATLDDATSGSENPRASGSPGVSNSSAWLTADPKPEWIWAKTHSNGQQVSFRHGFRIDGAVKSAKLYATCDNELTLFINGKKVGASPDWPQPIEKDVAGSLASGKNVIAAKCRNAGGIAGFVFKLVVEKKDGSSEIITSNPDWKLSEKPIGGWNKLEFDDSNWIASISQGPLGKDPWKIPKHNGADGPKGDDGLNPRSMLAAPGFVVDRIHKVGSDEGSWVALTTDHKGRLYACDQGGAGLFRITVRDGEDALVERVNQGDTGKLSGAQGLLWAFDALWFHRNGGHLYKATDSDGDDHLDTVEELPGTTGGGEHGNHAVILSAGGEQLLLDGGNHAPLAEHTRSRVPQWNEGLLLPRMWDARGHARGRLAPGGWINEVDPETYEQTVHTIGFRNQYDIALNRFGDIFTYDADMEWDMGMPWYRPTRICHAVSGGDFGWRSGSGKWPSYYEDSLPRTVDIGPGSPTGVVSGLGSAFPTRYQDAIFALDWTFGTIYAIHLTPEGASYRGEAEPFVTGSPLPVTDAIIGHDGALYFAVGGRGAKSGLFRVRYIGDESVKAPSSIDGAAAEARATRKSLEAFHGLVDGDALAAAWPHLSSGDRFIRSAARVAVESQPVESWAQQALSERTPQAAVTSAVALARMGNEAHKSPLLAQLMSIDAVGLRDGELLGLLRAYALTFINLGQPTAEEREQVIDALDPLLPHANADVNTELIRLLVYLRSETIAAKTIALIQNRDPVDLPDWSELASRNSRYGGPVQQMLDNHPPTHALAHAFMLRTLRTGWTIDLRRAYFTFLNEAASASGGSSYPGFLTRIRDEALGTCTDAEREALEDITGEDFDPKPDFEIAAIEGPGKDWTLEQAVGASRGKPNFERGRSLYFAAKCASCHRLSGLGGNIGPDLTSVRSKFDATYVLEAIIHPSKHISDQYGSSVVILEDGRVLNGLVVEGVGESADQLTIYSNKPDEEPIRISRDDVLEMAESKVSQMPEDLLNNLNGEEVRDLVAYILSAGDKSDRQYGR